MDLLISMLEQMCDPQFPKVSRLCNMLAVLYDQDSGTSWAGIYTIDPESSDAFLGPFQGKPACMKIPSGKGVIGECVKKAQPVCVDNVLEHSAHIACDSRSRSELVIPLRKEGRICAVLDLDSDEFSHFRSISPSQIASLQKLFESVL